MREWDDITVHVYWVKPGEDGELEHGIQYNGNIIPATGSTFTYCTSRTENGDYRPDGKVQHIVTGKVVNVTYSLEISGKDSRSYREDMWVDITLETGQTVTEEVIDNANTDNSEG